MELERLENGIRKIGKCNWKYWKMALGKLENVIGNIGFVGNWNEKH